MKSPLVSIVMNCYNSDRFLKEAIDSIYAQTYSNWEIIFWDNASTDGSASIAQSYDERVKYYLAPETTPLGEARNLALQKVTGKYIAFLDCDDLFLPDKLHKQVQLMESSDYALCYGSAVTINEYGDELRRVQVKNNSGYLLGELLKHYEINMQSVMVRSDVLTDDNLSFETSLQYCPDHNLFMVIASRYSIGVISDYIVKYRVLDNSLSRKTINLAASEVQFTLDRILKQQPEMRRKYISAFKQAYAKVHYYSAISSLYKSNRWQAINEIRTIVFVRYEYLLIFLLLLLPVRSKFIFKLLRR